MGMPKTAMHEDHLATPWKNNVRSARQTLRIEAETITHPMRKATHCQFRLRMLPTNTCHQGAAARGSAIVGHPINLRILCYCTFQKTSVVVRQSPKEWRSSTSPSQWTRRPWGPAVTGTDLPHSRSSQERSPRAIAEHIHVTDTTLQCGNALVPLTSIILNTDARLSAALVRYPDRRLWPLNSFGSRPALAQYSFRITGAACGVRAHRRWARSPRRLIFGQIFERKVNGLSQAAVA